MTSSHACVNSTIYYTETKNILSISAIITQQCITDNDSTYQIIIHSITIKRRILQRRKENKRINTQGEVLFNTNTSHLLGMENKEDKGKINSIIEWSKKSVTVKRLIYTSIKREACTEKQNSLIGWSNKWQKYEIKALH